MEFLSFILFLILGIYLLGAIGRWLLGRWISRKQREFAEHFGANGSPQQEDRAQDGEVRLRTKPTGNKRVSKNVGEYVEYEELESNDAESCDNEKNID